MGQFIKIEHQIITQTERKTHMEKIKMTTPLVEMDGDEMTRILWKIIKDELLTPFIDLKTEYYDLGLEYRDEMPQTIRLPLILPMPPKNMVLL